MAQLDPTEPNRVTNLQIGLVSDTDRELFGRWFYSASNTKDFTVQFDYQVSIGVSDKTGPPNYIYGSDSTTWIRGTEATVKYKDVYDEFNNGRHTITYSPPETATRVRFRVKPNATSHTVNGKSTLWYKSGWSSFVYHTFKEHVDVTPEKPSAPSVELTDTHIKAVVDTYDENTKYVQFDLIKNDQARAAYVRVEVKTNRAIGWFKRPSDGIRYKVRAAGFHTKSGNTYKVKGEYSEYSEDIYLPPSKPGGFNKSLCNLKNESTIQLFWTKSNGASSYIVEFTTDPSFFDSSEEVQSIEVEDNSYTDKDGKVYQHVEITGLTYQPATKYYFRVKAKSNSGESGWNVGWPYYNMKTGTKPTAPSTWSENSVLALGDPIRLYWVHNCEDQSAQTNAQVEFEKKRGKNTQTFTRQTGTNQFFKVNPEEEPTSSPFTMLEDGDTLSWRVRTIGALKTVDGSPAYGPWSVKRTIAFYAAPLISLAIFHGDERGYETVSGIPDPVVPVRDGGVVEGFPIYALTYTTPSSQTPISYRYSIIANETYETIDNKGDTIYVSAGETVYNVFVNDNGELINRMYGSRHIQTIQPWDVTLENDIPYTLRVEVLTDAGLSAENEMDFTTNLGVLEFKPTAQIAIDDESYCAYITPYCTISDGYAIEELVYNAPAVEVSEGVFSYTKVLSKEISGAEEFYVIQMDSRVDPFNYVYKLVGTGGISRQFFYISDTKFAKGTPNSVTEQDLYNRVQYTCSYDGNQSLTFTFTGLGSNVIESISTLNFIVHYATPDSVDMDEIGDRVNRVSGLIPINSIRKLAENVLLSVYRRDIDGEFTEIATGIQNDAITTVCDPHPALDYARYRIVAQSSDTGAITYYDYPDHPINSPYIVIQWDEQWETFESDEENEYVEPVYSGSRVMVKGNVDVSNSYNQDVSMVEYIGRSHPVAYHGTQIGETASWSCVIPSYDVETLSSIRRLARWMGVCYVREPNGTGYWATVGVSFNVTHSEVIIPITFSITRVEGGM